MARCPDAGTGEEESGARRSWLHRRHRGSGDGGKGQMVLGGASRNPRRGYRGSRAPAVAGTARQSVCGGDGTRLRS